MNTDTQKDAHLEAKNPLDMKTQFRSCWMYPCADDNLYLQGWVMTLLRHFVDNYKGEIEDSDVFRPIERLMRHQWAVDIFNACTTEKQRQFFCDGLARDGIPPEPGYAPADRMLKWLWNHHVCNAKLRPYLRDWLRDAVFILNDRMADHPDPVEARVDELARLFSFSYEETSILILETVLVNGMWPVGDFLNPSPQFRFKKAALHSKLLNMTEAQYLKLVGPKSKLRRLHCFSDKGAFNTDLIDFLTGMDDEPFSSRFYKRHTADPLPWDFFGTLAEKEGALLKQMVASRRPDQSMNFLLYGKPGTGKTSFAVALAIELGLTPYFVAMGREDTFGNGPHSFRFNALQLCAGQVDPEKSLIIIDEADDLLDGSPLSARPADKGCLNDAMDSVKIPLVWITNTPAWTLDLSNRRRFDYSIRFGSLTASQRKNVWHNAIAKHGLETVLDSTTAKDLISRYETSAGGIDLALRNLRAMLTAGQVKPADAKAVAEELLTTHCKLLDIRTDGKSKTSVRPDYSLDGLNIRGDITPRQIESAIRRFFDEKAAGTSADPDLPRMNLLFAGPPGTGKTEFVKYLGETVRAKVVTRMCSDLVTKWVGETEQNIRKAFEEAAGKRSILFLDEADGLFQSREYAKNSWEVTQVNELLQHMEDFGGVLVCATNFASRLDSATLRRFTFKMDFDYLDEDGKRLFFKRMFASFKTGALTAGEDARLIRIPNLTPGDYRTVRQSLYYLDADVTTGTLLTALERESAAKRDKSAASAIGFRKSA